MGGEAHRAASRGGRGERSEPAQAGGRQVLVLGLGNPLRGDDGVGPAVIAALRGAAGDGVRLIESAGSDLLAWLSSDAFGRIVIVDAADLGGVPGTWMHLTPDRLEARTGDAGHALDVRSALALLAAIGMRPAPISLYAIQPASLDGGPVLTREVRRAVPEVAAAILRELGWSRPSTTVIHGRGKDSSPDRPGSPLLVRYRQAGVTGEGKGKHGQDPRDR